MFDRIVILGAGESVNKYIPRDNDLVIAPNYLYRKYKVDVICITDLDPAQTLPDSVDAKVYIATPTYKKLDSPFEKWDSFTIIAGSGETEIERLNSFWKNEIHLGFHGIDTNNTIPNICFPLAYYFGSLNKVFKVAIYGVDCGGKYLEGYPSQLAAPNRLHINKLISIRGLRELGFHVVDHSKQRKFRKLHPFSEERMCNDPDASIKLVYKK